MKKEFVIKDVNNPRVMSDGQLYYDTIIQYEDEFGVHTIKTLCRAALLMGLWVGDVVEIELNIKSVISRDGKIRNSFSVISIHDTNAPWLDPLQERIIKSTNSNIAV